LHDVAAERFDFLRDARTAKTQQEAAETNLNQLEFSLNSIRPTRIVLKPQKAPIDLPSQRLSLLFLAALISAFIAAAVGAVLHSLRSSI
jgi:hypothetical protein